jgi:glycine hydroxymethyltransferase
MREIGAIAKVVLAATTPAAPGPDGKPQKAKYVTEPRAAEAARARVAELLRSFPLYPQLGDDL